MLQANPTLTFRYLCEEKTFLRLILHFSLEDEGPLPWYATKRLFASFATAIFRKICRGPHDQNHKYVMWATSLESTQKIY